MLSRVGHILPPAEDFSPPPPAPFVLPEPEPEPQEPIFRYRRP